MGSAIQPEDEDMKIGIVGAGQIGGTLTRRLTALGHKIFVANSDLASALEAATIPST